MIRKPKYTDFNPESNFGKLKELIRLTEEDYYKSTVKFNREAGKRARKKLTNMIRLCKEMKLEITSTYKENRGDKIKI